MLLNPIPEQNKQVFRSWLHSFGDPLHVDVEVLVVHLVHNLLLQYVGQLLRVHYEAGDGVRLASNGDEEFVVVTMPIAVGALAENCKVLLIAPFGNVQFVCGIKSFPTGEVKH